LSPRKGYKPKKQRLTPKQKRFVEEYLVDLNATQAGLRAGYKHADAGRHIITIPHVSAAITKAQAKVEEKAGVTVRYVLEGLMANYERAMQYREVADKDGNPLGEFVYRGDVANRALELIGKHLGMFREKIEFPDEHGKPQPVGGILSSLELATRVAILIERASVALIEDQGGETDGG
jgi:phage terminase small subunit